MSRPSEQAPTQDRSPGAIPDRRGRRVFVPGHFGELIQGRLGAHGPVALITLPCDLAGVEAWHRPGAGFRVQGAGLRGRDAVALLRYLDVALGGTVRLRPVHPPALGTGVSTAALLALAHLAGVGGADPLALSRACLAVEGASDPLAFAAPERVLWASRRGEVLAPLPTLPRFEILGGFWGPPCRTRPEDTRFPDISDLVSDWQAGPDLAQMAALTSESARRCLALRGPSGDPTEALAQALGALGVCISHSGAARGLIFAPGQVPPGAPAALRAAGLRGIIRFRGGRA